MEVTEEEVLDGVDLQVDTGVTLVVLDVMPHIWPVEHARETVEGLGIS